MPTTHTAAEIIDAAQQHINTLVARQWPEINEILENEEEITISAKIVVTARTAEVGEHPDKDNRVKTTISFAKKFSDSTESALDDPDQGELPLGDVKPVRLHVLYVTGDEGVPSSICDGNGEVVLGLCKVCGRGEVELGWDLGICPGPKPEPTNEELAESFDPASAGATVVVDENRLPLPGYYMVQEGLSQEGDMIWGNEEWEEVASPGTHFSHYRDGLFRKINASETFTPEPLAQRPEMTEMQRKLHEAAAGKETPLVPVLLSRDFTADKCRAQFRKAAKKAGWPEPCIDLLDDEAMKSYAGIEDDTEAVDRVLDVLNPHCVQEAK